MEETSSTFQLILRVGLPLLCIVAGASILVIGSLENIRWRFNISSSQQIWINISGGLLVLAGLGIILIPIFVVDRQNQELLVTPTELPPVFINITTPDKTINCGGSTAVCSFEISGIGGGVAPPMDQYRVATFVFPLEPLGAGYFIQPRFVVMQDDGSWFQSGASFGNNSIPADNGQKIRIRAALISQDASIDGNRLDQLPQDFYLGRVEDIEGIISLSLPVDLIVEK